MYLKVLRKLLEHEKEALLYKPSPADLKLAYSASVRILDDIT